MLSLLVCAGLLGLYYDLFARSVIIPAVLAAALLSALTALTAGLLQGRYQPAGGERNTIQKLLSELADREDFEAIAEQIMIAPPGEGSGKPSLGWNRLVNAFDVMHREIQTLRVARKTIENYGVYDTQRFATIIDLLPDGVLLIDSQGEVAMANRRCEGLINRTAGELIGCAMQSLFENNQAIQHLEQFRQAGQPETQFEIQHGEGLDTTIYRIYCIKLGAQQSNAEMFILIRDITQQKIVENAQGDFIAHVSHELRTPLTNIRAYAETLLSDMVLDASAQKEAFNVINEETIRLTKLINDVLDLSRMESGAMQLERGEVMLDRLVRQCVNDIKGMAASKSITVQTNFHPKLPNLYADRDKLAVVLNNVFSNAIKYTPDGGTIFVETNVDENCVYIKTTDTGYGIAPEYLEKIFEKFYRIEREETVHITGTGLGLATCREIVQAHGGSIYVASQLNNGTEMTVKLPLTKIGPVLGPSET